MSPVDPCVVPGNGSREAAGMPESPASADHTGRGARLLIMRDEDREETDLERVAVLRHRLAIGSIVVLETDDEGLPDHGSGEAEREALLALLGDLSVLLREELRRGLTGDRE